MDSYLADLEELSDTEEGPNGPREELDEEMEDVEALKVKDDDLDTVAQLQKSQRYHDTMKKVEEAIRVEARQVSEDDPEYQLIVDCNALSVDIENEIGIVHNFIRDKYRLKFPELESIVHHPTDYARVVKRIGNEMDVTLVDLDGLLPSSTIMIVTMAASTSRNDKPLSEGMLQKTLDACDRALDLDEAKMKVLSFVEGRMAYIAPNLSAVVGSAVAAKLIGIAGGLSALAKMPACNVQVLGAKRKLLAGFSTATHTGFIFHADVLQGTPPPLRTRACHLVSGKATLAARVDATRGDPSGQTGRGFREVIGNKIEKWQELPPAKQPRSLPVPNMDPTKKRGGRRSRKMKEKYAVTDMRKLANKMKFGVPEETSLGDGLGKGYGMLGQAGNGKLRVSVSASRLASKVKKTKEKNNYGSGSSGASSGFTSSFAFTPVQGIELFNPSARAGLSGSGRQSMYFSETGLFSKPPA